MISNTLYAKYIKEREGLEIIEDESFFLTYKIVGEECFIANIFVDPSARGGFKLKNAISQLSGIAKKHSCKYISGTLDLKDPGLNRTMAAALKLSFNILKAEHGIILIAKGVH